MSQTSTTRSLWQGGAVAGSKPSKRKTSLQTVALLAFFTFEVICLTVLQKFAVYLGFGELGGLVQLVLPLTYAALFVMVFFVKVQVDILRLALLSTLFICAFLSVMLQTHAYSVNSVMLLIAIYIPFILYIEVSEGQHRKLMGIFLNAMIVFGAIVFIQQITQLVWTWRIWPNIDKLASPDFLMDGFNYIQPIKYRSLYMKPNAVFFLEVSYVSQWTAIALGLEIVYFRRIWRMVFYAAVLLACFAGTGLLLLLVTAPVLLTGLSRKSLAMVAVVVAAGVLVAVGIDWFPQVQQRIGEFSQAGASGNHRFVEPYRILTEFISQPSSLMVGEGPGSAVKTNGGFWWVVTKLAYEYGVLTAVAYFAFLGYVLFKNAPSQRIAFLLIIFFNFMGGVILPVYPLLVFLLGGLFRVRPSKTA